MIDCYSISSRAGGCGPVGARLVHHGRMGHPKGISPADGCGICSGPGSQRDIDAAVGVDCAVRSQAASHRHVARRVHLRDGGKGLLGCGGGVRGILGGGCRIGFRRLDSAFRFVYFPFGGFCPFDKGRDCLHGFRLGRFHGCDSSALCAGYLVRGGFLRSPYSKNGISLLGLYGGNSLFPGRADRLFPVADRLRKI